MQAHNHSHCIDAALETAESLCAKRGTRLTDIRRRVLEMVWQGHKAVKAYDLLDQLSADGISAKPPTVYRALDFLITEGLVHKIESMNAYVGCPHPDDDHVSQFLICDQCEAIQEVNSAALDQALGDAAQSAGFQTNRQTIELHGHCASCRAS